MQLLWVAEVEDRVDADEPADLRVVLAGAEVDQAGGVVVAADVALLGRPAGRGGAAQAAERGLTAADRVLRLPAPPREPGLGGRPPRHGKEFRLTDAETWSDPAVITTTDTTRYGTVIAIGWDGLHPG